MAKHWQQLFPTARRRLKHEDKTLLHDSFHSSLFNLGAIVCLCVPVIDHWMGKPSMNPIHPEGRLVAIQQQMFFASLLGEKMGVDTEIVLRKLAMCGLGLVTDANEITTDAAAVLPNLNKYKAHKLQAVPDLGDNE